jgi:hypothetical protein
MGQTIVRVILGGTILRVIRYRKSTSCGWRAREKDFKSIERIRKLDGFLNTALMACKEKLTAVDGIAHNTTADMFCKTLEGHLAAVQNFTGNPTDWWKLRLMPLGFWPFSPAFPVCETSTDPNNASKVNCCESLNK